MFHAVSYLLNGAFVPHEKQGHHTLSRGKILMEMAAVHTGVEEYFQERGLSHVEPFTIITIEHQQGMISHFSESIWDGSEKHYQEPGRQRPYIWSTVTLYGEECRYIGGQWFQKFYKEQLPLFLRSRCMAFTRALIRTTLHSM